MKKLRLEFADTMLEIGLNDPRLVVMVGDISHGILQPYAKACPGRYYNIGICEPTIVNMAAGLNKTGLIPVVHTIAPFITERSYEQIKLDFGYQNLSGNIVFEQNITSGIPDTLEEFLLDFCLQCLYLPRQLVVMLWKTDGKYVGLVDKRLSFYL